MNRLVSLLLLSSLVGCAELDPPTLIKRDRVLGAKVSVDGDPERAWPAPGETATMTWITASPDAPPTFSWVLTACPAASSTGMPACAGPMFATDASSGPVPTLRLAIPAELATDAVVVMGAICASGAPVIDDARATCDDGSRADVVSQHVFIATADAANHNPDLAGAPFTLDGQPWETAAVRDCADLPVVAAGAEGRRVGVTFDAADRERFTARDTAGDTTGLGREELQLAAFATAGEVIQQHTYVDPADERDTSPVTLEWDAPDADDVPAQGLRVTFFFVVRDLRGGVDTTTRELCVR